MRIFFGVCGVLMLIAVIWNFYSANKLQKLAEELQEKAKELQSRTR